MSTQVADGKTKMQFVVTDEFKATLHARAQALGTTMTDVMITAVEKQIAADLAREARLAERRAGK